MCFVQHYVGCESLEQSVTPIVSVTVQQQSQSITLLAVKPTAKEHTWFLDSNPKSPKPTKLTRLLHMACLSAYTSISVSCCSGLEAAYRQGRMLVLTQHYLGTLALEEEVYRQWAACSEPHEQAPGASWGSLVQGGDALGPSSTWHDADAAGAQWHLSALHPSPCKFPTPM